MQRRDFLNGIPIAVAGTQMASRAAAQTTDAAYPPLAQGLRGQYPDAVADFAAIAEGTYAKSPVADSEIHEEYDLVIVGAGISGLAAAHFYRSALGTRERILI